MYFKQEKKRKYLDFLFLATILDCIKYFKYIF